MRRILCIWFPLWPIQRLVIARPELQGQAIVLHASQSRRGRCVVGCSAAAAACGVRCGMPLAEVSTLVQRGAAFCLQPHDQQADRHALEQLAASCEPFSPVVGLEATDQPTCLLLDIPRLQPVLGGGEEVLLGHVLQSLRQQGCSVRMAIADTLGTAWAMAHFAAGKSEPVIVPPGKNLEALRPLPVEALRLPEATVQQLEQLGVLTIGQLAALPRVGWRSRFGDELLRRWDQATGALQEMIVAHRPPPPLEAHWALEHPTTRREVIECVLVHLLERLVPLLVQQNQGVIQLLCQLDCAQGRAVRIEVGLFRATATAGHLRELLQMQLEQLTLPGPVHQVLLRAITTAPLEDRQHQLLEDAARDVPRHVARLINRLSSRLGRDGVLGARRQSDAQVEYAYRYIPLTGQPARAGRGANKGQQQPCHAPGQRPLRLYVPPWPTEVVAVVPHGPPVSFHYQGQRQSVAQHWGPERIETGWWRGSSVRRDYYRVENPRGNRFWLFRRLHDGKWFVQGSFE